MSLFKNLIQNKKNISPSPLMGEGRGEGERSASPLPSPLPQGERGFVFRGGDERGFSLASVIFTVLILGALGLSMSPVVSTVSRGSLAELQGQQAFFVAEGGLQYILMKDFQEDQDFSDNNPPGSATSLDPGSFTLTYVHSGTDPVNKIIITSTGTVGIGVRQVQQNVTKAFSSSGALHSGGDTEMISSQGGGGDIIGPKTYGDNGNHFTYDGGYDMNGVLPQPGPGPGPVSLASLIAFTTSTVTGNLSINGNYTNNVHVTGNVNIQGSGTITGIIIADGDVTVGVGHNETRIMNGTLGAGGHMDFNAQQGGVATFTAQQVGGNYQPLLIAVGDISFDDFQQTTATFNGLIRAGGDVDFKLRQQDTVTINGGIVANGDITSDSKQDSFFTVDFGNGTQFLSHNLKLESWKEV